MCYRTNKKNNKLAKNSIFSKNSAPLTPIGKSNSLGPIQIMKESVHHRWHMSSYNKITVFPLNLQLGNRKPHRTAATTGAGAASLGNQRKSDMQTNSAGFVKICCRMVSNSIADLNFISLKHSLQPRNWENRIK